MSHLPQYPLVAPGAVIPVRDWPPVLTVRGSWDYRRAMFAVMLDQMGDELDQIDWRWPDHAA